MTAVLPLSLACVWMDSMEALWMSDSEGAHDDIQVGEVAGVNDPGNIPWRTTVWRAGGEDVGSVKVSKRVGESFKQSFSVMSGKTVTSALHRVAPSGNDAEQELPKGSQWVTVETDRLEEECPWPQTRRRKSDGFKTRRSASPRSQVQVRKVSMGDHPAVITVVIPKPDTYVTLKGCHKINVCCLPTLTSPLWGWKIKELFNSGSALYLLSEKVITLTEGITFWKSHLNFGVWIPNLGALPILTSVSLTHLPCLSACFYESVSCVYVVFSTYLSTYVARAACFVFCSISLTAFSFSFSLFYKFHEHLCHGAYWCTHNPANMPKPFFHLHLHFFNSCVCVSKHVYTFPWASSSILIHIYCHIHMYVLCPVLYL